MINKFLIILFLCSSVLYSQQQPVYTTGAVVVAGSIVLSKNNIDTKKYKRKDCPVCKGKGWYVSGDGISRVTCGYCEAEDTRLEKNHLQKVSK